MHSLPLSAKRGFLPCVCMSVCVSVCTYSMCMCIFVCVCESICMCVTVCLCVCVCVCEEARERALKHFSTETYRREWSFP